MATGGSWDNRKLHIVMFPWLAFGHIIPFLELAKLVARKGHKVSFVSTPRNIQRLPRIPPDLASSIDFVKIPLPRVEGLPENAEATMDVTVEESAYLKKAHDAMEPELALFLENSCADAVIYDFTGHWVPKIAIKLGISRFCFCIFKTWFMAFLGNIQNLINELEGRKRPEDLVYPPKWVTFDTSVAYEYYEAKAIVGIGEKNASGFSDAYRGGIGISLSDAVIIRHCNEFETDWFELLKNLYQKEVIPIGFLPPQFQETAEIDSQIWDSAKEWLDIQRKESVLYIALGSEATPNQDQLNELAYGLESSRLPFFWAFRTPEWSKNREMIKLPDGFEERTKDQGVVWKGWAPQLKILNHNSTGAFLTHSGFTSVIESFMFGVPLILLPIFADQWLNARVLDEKQIGLEVPRNGENGSFTRSSVAQAVRTVMIEDGGKKFRDKAKEMRSVLGDKQLHDQYVDKFIDYLVHSRTAATNKYPVGDDQVWECR